MESAMQQVLPTKIFQVHNCVCPRWASTNDSNMLGESAITDGAKRRTRLPCIKWEDNTKLLKHLCNTAKQETYDCAWLLVVCETYQVIWQASGPKPNHSLCFQSSIRCPCFRFHNKLNLCLGTYFNKLTTLSISAPVQIRNTNNICCALNNIHVPSVRANNSKHMFSFSAAST